MDREENEIVELGVASVETQGKGNGLPEASGRQIVFAGISED